MKETLEKAKQLNSVLLNICRKLESIADELPNSLVNRSCIETVEQLSKSLQEAHKFEADQIFPVISDHGKNFPEFASALVRLRNEHMEDEGFVDEITETLLQYKNRGKDHIDKGHMGNGHIGIEAIGYMMRGFFEGLRRHIAFENEFLYPYLLKIGAYSN